MNTPPRFEQTYCSQRGAAMVTGEVEGSARSQNSAAHTPGPWHWDNDYLRPNVPNPDGSAVHTVLGSVDGYISCWGYLGSDLDKTTAENDANRRLIAAAPELLEALQTAEWFMRGFEDDELQDGINIKLHIIRHALAKATGADQ